MPVVHDSDAGCVGRDPGGDLPPVRVGGEDRDPRRERRAGCVVLGAVDQDIAAGARLEPDGVLARRAGAPLRERVAEVPPGEHLGEEELLLRRVAGLAQHLHEEEVVLRDLPDARVPFGEESDQLAHRAGRDVGAAELARRRHTEQPGRGERGDLGAGQPAPGVPLAVAGGEVGGELAGDGECLRVVHDHGDGRGRHRATAFAAKRAPGWSSRSRTCPGPYSSSRNVRPGVVLGQQPAATQLRHDEFHEVDERARRDRVSEVEPVDVGDLDPALHLVDDGLRAPDHHDAHPADADPFGDVAGRPVAVRVDRGEGLDGAAHGLGLRVPQRLVGVHRGQVEPAPAAVEGERALEAHVAPVLVVLRLRLLVGGRGDHRHQREELDRARVPAQLRGERAGGGDRAAEDLRPRRRGEDALGVRGGEPAPARRRPRLEDHRRCAAATAR